MSAKLAWSMGAWCGRWPSFGGDEYLRKTLVLPWPFPKDLTGEADWWRELREACGFDAEYHAVCIVIRPWWLTKCALRKDYRAWARHQRAEASFDESMPNPAPAGWFDEQRDVWLKDHPEPPEPRCFARERAKQ